MHDIVYYFPKQQNLFYCGPEGLVPGCDADYASKTLDPASDYDRVFGGSSTLAPTLAPTLTTSSSAVIQSAFSVMTYIVLVCIL